MILLAVGLAFFSLAVFLFLFPAERVSLPSVSRLDKDKVWAFVLIGASVLGAVFFTNFFLLAAGSLVSYLYLRKRKELEKKKTAEKLEEDFEVFLGVLGPLYGVTKDLMGSMERAALCVPDPLSSEVKRAVREYRETNRLKPALENLAERVPSRGVRFFVDAVLEAERYGVEIEEVMEPMAKVLRDRAALREELRSEVKGNKVTIQVLLVLLPAMLAMGLLVVPRAQEILSASFFGQAIVAAVPLVEYAVWAAFTRVEEEMLAW